MKKYTQPTVEITAFDFEDITMSTGGGSTPATNMGEGFTESKDTFTAAANAAGYNVVEW